MRISSITALLVLTLCLTLTAPCVALSASFGEFTSGVKTLTGAAKDVKDIKNGEKKEQEPEKAAPSSKKTAPKKESSKRQQPVPEKESRVRGG